MVKTEFCERDKADLSLAETLQGRIQVKSKLMTNSAGGLQLTFQSDALDKCLRKWQKKKGHLNPCHAPHSDSPTES
jgi:hypothetical protein